MLHTSSSVPQSLGCACLGCLAVLLSLILLGYNEQRAAQTWASLEEGRSQVREVPCPLRCSENASSLGNTQQRGLVHASCAVCNPPVLQDEDFAVQVTALKLERTVEMLQWQEQKIEEKVYNDDTDQTGAHQTHTGRKRYRYTYNAVWSQHPISSTHFQQGQYRNPGRQSWPASSKEMLAPRLQLGGLLLGPDVLHKLDRGWESVAPVRSSLQLRGYRLNRSGNGYEGRPLLHEGYRPSSSSGVGEVRVRHRRLMPQVISFVGEASSGGELHAYRTHAGDDLLLASPEGRSAEEMFDDAVSANTALTWTMRCGGFLLMFVGFLGLFSPLVAAAECVPFIGSCASQGAQAATCVLACALAIPLAAAVVAISWIFLRPGVAVGALAVGLGAMLAAAWQRRHRRAGKHGDEQGPYQYSRVHPAEPEAGSTQGASALHHRHADMSYDEPPPPPYYPDSVPSACPPAFNPVYQPDVYHSGALPGGAAPSAPPCPEPSKW